MVSQLLIADVPWLLYRAFFGLPKSIRGADGRPVNALLGTVNAILSVYEGRLTAPDVCVVACTGAEQAAYRVALYPPYHAHREPMPEELASQWKLAPALLESLGWTVATSEDLEADDVMFSYARYAQDANGGETQPLSGDETRPPSGSAARDTAGEDAGAPAALLLTGDRDLYGAVDERVSVVELLKGGKQGLIGPEQVRERYGVEPKQVADFIALRGDPSDGLPGAPGIGAKTAAELLRAHGTLEALLAAAEQADPALRPRTAATLREHAQLLRTFAHIATLQRVDVERPRDAATDFAGGAAKAGELGMRGLAQRLEGMIGAV
jgi:5'-3' exonuclease